MPDGAGEAVKAGFTPQFPVVRNLLNGLWELVEPVTYCAPDGRQWVAPAGFLTDWGSVPDVVDWIIPSNSTEADLPYLFHDLLYHLHRTGQDACRDRADADGILYDALLVCGVARWLARLIWAGVRAGGFVAWNRKAS